MMTFRPIRILIFTLTLLSSVVTLAQTKTTTDRSEPKAMAPEVIAAGLKSHNRALYIKTGWIRDPYIMLAPDSYYYLTGTTPLPNDPREQVDRYNDGLGDDSIVGWKMQLWRSKDLIEWEYLKTPFSLKDGIWPRKMPKRFVDVDEAEWRLWAPELHFLNGKRIIVHTSPSPARGGANLAISQSADVTKRPYDNPMGIAVKQRHDPSLFQDGETIYMLWSNTMIAPIKKDFSGYAAEPVRIDPSNRKIGHEGATMRKIGEKYVHFGTAWSTDQGRKGSYNLYYCTADKPTGPFGPRQFAGRFLGHGTPFLDKQGQWWCTAFFNGNVPPLTREQARGKDLSETAQTINEQGVTIVPLEVRTMKNGKLFIRAIDPDYAKPGPDEAQEFEF